MFNQPQPGQMATGPYGAPPTGPRATPPTQQMGGLSLGPPPPLSSSHGGMMPSYPGVQGPQYGLPPSQPSAMTMPSQTHPPMSQAPPTHYSQFGVTTMQTPTGGLQGTPPTSAVQQSYAHNVSSMAGPPPPANPMQQSRPQFMQQGVSGQAPPYSGQSTPVSGQAPPYSGQMPPVSGQAPHYSGQSTLVSGQAPPYSGQMPPVSGQAPHYSGQMPPVSGQVPPYSGQMPPVSGQAPPYSGQMLPVSGQAPTYSGQPAPAIGQVSPTHPMTTMPPPPMSGQEHRTLGQVPPTSGQMYPSGQAQMYPTSGRMPPTSGQGPPFSGQMPPTSGQGPPFSGQMPPTSGQGPPFSRQMPPTSGQGPPFSGQMPPPTSGQVPTFPGQAPPPMHPQMPSQQFAYSGPPPSTLAGPQMGRPPNFTGPPPPGYSKFPPPGPPGPPGMPTAPIQQQPRSRIDPDQMPNPVIVMKLDQDQRGHAPFLTSTQGIPPPLVTTHFHAQDDGNCNPRYMRATMYTVPCTKDLLNSCRLPMGLVIQPLANVPPKENILHVVDHGPQGPIRCNRCKAYMNPLARFIDGGRQYLCPICQCSNEVPQEYFCHLDHQGRRTDTLQRPELCFGSVEYAATKDYCKEGKLPKPPAYIFMIDVSVANIQNSILNLLSQTILGLLDHLPGSTESTDSPVQVGFVTYDRVIHFYNVKASLAQPQMMVLTDISDVFVPMVDGFLVNATEAKIVLESLMSQLPGMFAGNKTPDVILEPVVRAGMEALKAAGTSGRLFVFHSGRPTAPGPGNLKNRMDTKLLGTDKEKTLLTPASSPYQKLAEECVKFGVGVELFLFPGSYSDTATLGHFVSTTGGELHYYRNYQTGKDGGRLIEDLKHSLSRNTAFDAVMRLRASTGLRPTGFFGAFYMANTTDIELGNIDTDKAIAVEIKHDDKLKEDETAFFQAALLYTDVYGQRRLRIHNLALTCSTKLQDIYRSCEVDTIMNFFSKSISHASLSMPYKNIRESFTHQCAVILACYRKHCSSHSPPGQLILPESLKLLPMYANCLLKSDALLSPPVVSLDEKCWLMYYLQSMTLRQSGAFLYPRMIALHNVDVDEKTVPPVIRCTGQKLQDSGAYVIENGLQMVVWVGQQVSADFVNKVFGVASHAQINTEISSLPALDNPLSFRVRGILSQLQSKRQHYMKLFVTKHRDSTEVLYRRMLKEDKGAGQWEGTSYIDFLCQVHRDIKEILS